jgi:uncharacterized membrane protein YukC
LIETANKRGKNLNDFDVLMLARVKKAENILANSMAQREKRKIIKH